MGLSSDQDPCKLDVIKALDVDELFDNFEQYNSMKKISKKDKKLQKEEKRKEDLNINLLKIFDELEESFSSEDEYESHISDESERTRRKTRFNSNLKQNQSTQKKNYLRVDDEKLSATTYGNSSRYQFKGSVRTGKIFILLIKVSLYIFV